MNLLLCIAGSLLVLNQRKLLHFDLFPLDEWKKVTDFLYGIWQKKPSQKPKTKQTHHSCVIGKGFFFPIWDMENLHSWWKQVQFKCCWILRNEVGVVFKFLFFSDLFMFSLTSFFLKFNLLLFFWSCFLSCHVFPPPPPKKPVLDLMTLSKWIYGFVY